MVVHANDELTRFSLKSKNDLSSGGRRKITNLNGAEGKYFPAHPARYTHTRVLVTQRRVIAMR